jgi:hypothetical protein
MFWAWPRRGAPIDMKEAIANKNRSNALRVRII